ncbi:MAG: hypothetical protein V7638_4509 [Acidobacteriota bacterium]
MDAYFLRFFKILRSQICDRKRKQVIRENHLLNKLN